MPLPIAGITAAPTSGPASTQTPLTVQFADASINGPILSWLWDFGDGGTSTLQNPQHDYREPGVYSVSLFVTNASGSDSVTLNNFVEGETPAPFAEVMGPLWLKCTRDAEGHREYRIAHKVHCGVYDGPGVVLQAPGLPTPGSFWQIFNDYDEWATCLWNATVTPMVEVEKCEFYIVEQVFSTKSPDTRSCKDTQVEDPLLEPAKISSSSVRYMEEATYDRFGNIIETSSHELIKGPTNEWDRNRRTFRIEQNVASLYQADTLPDQMLDTVNDAPLWGRPPRCVKLSDASFEVRFFGACSKYYVRVLTFETRAEGFDRDLLDYGTKALSGRHDPATDAWVLVNVGIVPPDRSNPSHFNQYQDRNGNNCAVVLDGRGEPSGVTQLGTRISVLAPTVISSSVFNEYLLPGQEVAFGTSRKLRINVADDDFSIADGTLTVTGTDSHGNEISETFDLADFGTTDFITQKKFDSVTSIVTENVSGAGPGSLDTIEVLGDNTVSQAGRIHVEKYDESDFTQLGIPLTL